jgi:hypothetical protein
MENKLPEPVGLKEKVKELSKYDQTETIRISNYSRFLE